MDRLPAELMMKIVGDSQISHSDLRRLRLVSKHVTATATSRLFTRIYISKLHSDRDAFFNIAAQPHLAVAVRSVTWLELAEDDTDLPYVANPPVRWLRLPQDQLPSAGVADDLDFLLCRLPRMARALFWLPFEDFSSYFTGTEKRMQAISSFMPDFFAALDRMLNLREFASRPMHPKRELIQPLESFTSVSPTVLHEAEDELEEAIWLLKEAHAMSVIRRQSMFDGAFELGQAIAKRTVYLYTHFYAPSLLRISCFDRHDHVLQPVVEYKTVKNCDDATYNSDQVDDDEIDTEEAAEADDELAKAPPGLLGNHDASHSNDSSTDSGWHIETAAEASIHKMLATAPRWELGIGRDDTACCWKVTVAHSSHDSYPTRVWRFLHRNGEQAMGDEPLEFWDDWEGSQSGDCYEPTPFGPELDSFMRKHGLQGVPEIPQDWEAREMSARLKEPC
ncbi:hypothetical protein M419DRAFT_11050 [Trichoderma reesei RUT C-30]|uniref:F-box domain-containing protein n=1 Tax=Hypocrea jecorina (strain ATCC 56765 / BCRC 32924 / NRRL 11460 / Rut C-30) TaxID=1344414 RepID=A0A024S532_HYPJR|nr:hypothetical protein M419DRAFT_11050 [Trichoderma reesei RUT C-30]